MKIANLKETRKQNGGIRFFFSPRRETETLFFYSCGGVLLSTNLSLTLSCWHIGRKFFDSLLMISSGRAVFGSLSLLIAVAAVRSSKYKRHPESGRNRWYYALCREGSLIGNTYSNPILAFQQTLSFSFFFLLSFHFIYLYIYFLHFSLF